MIKDPILVIDDAPRSRTVSPALVAMGYRVVSACNCADGLREFEATRPPWVIVGAGIHDASDLVDEIHARCGDIQILVTTTGNLEPAVAAFNSLADEFLALPVTPPLLAAALRRMEKVVRLRRQVRSLSKNLASHTSEHVRNTIETERFLAVRQIVEKMSAFIRQVASDAQGGDALFQ